MCVFRIFQEICLYVCRMYICIVHSYVSIVVDLKALSETSGFTSIDGERQSQREKLLMTKLLMTDNLERAKNVYVSSRFASICLPVYSFYSYIELWRINRARTERSLKLQLSQHAHLVFYILQIRLWELCSYHIIFYKYFFSWLFYITSHLSGSFPSFAVFLFLSEQSRFRFATSRKIHALVICPTKL